MKALLNVKPFCVCYIESVLINSEAAGTMYTSITKNMGLSWNAIYFTEDAAFAFL